jgi:hypothetical protein
LLAGEDIPLLIGFYNENNDPFPLGSAVICFGTISFHEQTTGFPFCQSRLPLNV